MTLRRTRSLTIAALVGVALTACSSTGGSGAGTASSPATGTPSTSCDGASTDGTNPLTGRPGRPTGPVVAVKVSNTVTRDASARPQSGLPQADQVWIEEVEAGRTRFVAVFGTRQPGVVGPVRSGRETDLELLPAFGRPGIAYAGANPAVQQAFKDAAEAGRIVDLGKDATVDGRPVRSGEGAEATYFTDPTRKGTASFYANACALVPWAVKGGAQPAREMGFTFGAAPTGGGAGTSATVRWSKASIARFDFRDADGSYTVGFDGQPLADRESGAVLTADSVVVLRVSVTTSQLTSAPPYVVPISSTVGRGAATVLRDGRAWTGTWSRASATDPLVLLDARGAPIPLKAGRTWVSLLPDGNEALSRIPGDTRSLAVG